MKDNMIFVDYVVPQEWKVLEGIEKETCKKWSVKYWKNNSINTKWDNIKRYFGYFIHSLSIFLNRNKYDGIIAWQQFYGILFACYCRLFKVKKVNKLMILTFIYRSKETFAGKIQKMIVEYAVTSQYVDKIAVYSKQEIEWYSNQFNIDICKFVFYPLGTDSVKELSKTTLKLSLPFFLSVGRSNRDYEFLFKAVENKSYQVVVLADTESIPKYVPSNVRIYTDIIGDDYLRIIKECYAMIIPLKDPNISSGQLVILDSLKYGKPIIITESNATKDYVTDGVDALICIKNVDSINEAIDKLLIDKKVYDFLSNNGKKICEEKFSMYALGENIGKNFKE